LGQKSSKKFLVILEEEEKIKRELHPPPPPKSLKVIGMDYFKNYFESFFLESDKTEVATKNSIPNSKTNRSPTLKRRTEEKGSVEKDLTLSRVVSAEKDLRISRVASAEKELKISRVESLSGAIASAGTGGSKVIDGQQEESMKVPKLVRRTEQTDQTQVNKAPEVLVTAPKTVSSLNELIELKFFKNLEDKKIIVDYKDPFNG